MTSFHFVLLGSAFTLLGCSSSPGGDDDPQSWVPSDIDQQATLDAIGAAGYAKVCGAFSDYVHDTYRSQLLVKAACTAHALQTTTDAVTCGAELDACLDTLPPVVDQQLQQILAQASCAAIGLEPDGCPSTVTALKGCLDALGDLVEQVELSATCAAFGSPVPADWWMVGEPAACATLRNGC
jgi:hypothetical protein